MTTDPFTNHTGLWVGIDVVATAFGVKPRQAYEIARRHGWRTRPAHYPRQYSFVDVRNTYNRQKGTST